MFTPKDPTDRGAGAPAGAGRLGRSASLVSAPACRFGAAASWAWVILALVAWMPGIATQALIDPDEGRNASIALEMAAGADPLLPRLNGLPFLDKPFLYFWLQSVAIRALGATELAVRLPSIAASVLLVALVGWLARRLWGELSAWISTFALATSLLTVGFARIASFDAVLTLTVTAAAAAFLLVLGAAGESGTVGGFAARREPLLTFAWIAMALGVMVKGPVALLLPLAPAQAFAWIRGDRRGPWSAPGVAVFAALLGAWLWLTERSAPGFLRYALFDESWKRVTTDQYARTGPIWYFVPILLVGAAPWILSVMPGAGAGIHRCHRQHRAMLFLALWLLLPLVLFSLSQSKRPQYALPLIPAVALLSGGALVDETLRSAFARRAAAFWLAAGILLVAVGVAQSPGAELVDYLRPGESIRFTLLFGGVCIASAASIWGLRRSVRPAIVAAALPVLLLPHLSTSIVARVSEARSGRELAAAIAPRAGEAREVVGVGAFVPSLPFYLGAPIRLSAPTPESLTSRSMVRFADEIAKQRPATWRPADWWRSTLDDRSGRYVYIVKSNHRREIEVLERAGLSRLFVGPKLVAYGRPGSGTLVAPPTTATSGLTRTAEWRNGREQPGRGGIRW